MLTILWLIYVFGTLAAALIVDPTRETWEVFAWPHLLYQYIREIQWH